MGEHPSQFFPRAGAFSLGAGSFFDRTRFPRVRRGAVTALWLFGAVSLSACQSLPGPFAPAGQEVPLDQYGWQETAQPEPTAVLASADLLPQQLAVHRVQRGETAWSIARRHGVSVDELSRVNRLDDAGEITAGTDLQLPDADAPEVSARPEVSAAAVDTGGIGSVALYSDEFQVTELAAADAGSEPAEAWAQDQDADSLGTHRVQPGETLWRISRRYEVTPVQMAALNGISPTGILRSGTILRVPRSEARPPEVAPEAESVSAPASEASFAQAPACEELPDVAAAAPGYSLATEDTAASYSAIDGVLALGDSYLESARFEETIDLAELGLNLLGDHWVREDSGPRIAHAEMIRGVALVALKRPHEGHACFRRALRIEPEIELGPGTSPKVERVFDAARVEVQSAMSSAVPLTE